MKVVCVTSDKYRNILGSFSKLFNKHWSKDQEVDILHYKKPDIELPENFKLVQIGEQSGWNWCWPIVPYLENLQEEYLFFCMEDHFMFQDMDFDLLNRAEDEIKKSNIGKIMCHYNPRINREDPGEHYNDDFLIWNLPESHGMNRGPHSLMASIWKRDYLLSILYTTRTVSEFESRPIIKDGRYTLFPKKHFVYPQLDACRAGKFNECVLDENFVGDHGEFVDDSDRKIFAQAQKDLNNTRDIIE